MTIDRTYTCLITATQESEQLQKAIQSGVSDGWNTEYYLDTRRDGQNKSTTS